MTPIQESTCQIARVNSIADYLRKDTPFGVVSSTTPTINNESLQSNNQIKQIKKEKQNVNLLNQISCEYLDTIELLPTGHVKYGPITVHPRKKPSKTIYTGRRSKNEILYGEDEEKRRSRRERNRVAATKCREKREKALIQLEEELRRAQIHHQALCSQIEQLQQRKQQLEYLLPQSITNYSVPVKIESNIVYNQIHLPVTSKSNSSSQSLEFLANNFEQFPTLLINTTQSNDFNHSLLNQQIQQQEQIDIAINSSSINRILDECVPPFDLNNKHSKLYNSACGPSTCAQQYSSSSSNEDDSMASSQRNSFVC